MKRNDERGAALVLALLVLALLVGVILQFDAEARRELREAAGFRDSVKAITLARAGVDAARGILKYDLTLEQQAGRAFDAPTDLWARPIAQYPVGDGVISATIEDERGKLNLNDLANAPDPLARQAKVARLKRLFLLMDVDPRLVDAVCDWVDGDDLSEPHGAESAYYLALEPPYRAANHPLQSLRELRLVKGVTPAIIARLAPVVTVYPLVGDGVVNMNTADPRVLQAMDPRITAAMALAIVQQRPFYTIQDLDRVANLEPIAKELRLTSTYAVRSDHFSVSVRATVNEVTKDLHAVIHRSTTPGQDSVTVLRFGHDDERGTGLDGDVSGMRRADPRGFAPRTGPGPL